MNFYPHHIGDFNKKTRHLSRVERSIYRDAIDLYYDTEEILTNNIKNLERVLLVCTDEEKEALQCVLGEFFILKPDGYHHNRCDEELLKYQSFKTHQSQAGKASAAKRKKPNKSNGG